MRQLRRFRVLVHPKFQGQLCLRIAGYWVCCLLCVGLILTWQLAFDGNYNSAQQWLWAAWQRFGAAVIAPLLFLPILGLDATFESVVVLNPGAPG